MAIAYGLLGHDKSMDMGPVENDSVAYIFIMEMIFSWFFETVYRQAKVRVTSPTAEAGLIGFSLMAYTYVFSAMV